MPVCGWLRARRCSGRGWCSEPKNWGNPEQKLAPFCKCQGFYEGDTCATPANEHCYASCSGRGTCVGGFCHCQEGWWGLGCTRSKAYEGQGACGSALAARAEAPSCVRVRVRFAQSMYLHLRAPSRPSC